jgi:iron(III) transport system substrate-binding protein
MKDRFMAAFCLLAIGAFMYQTDVFASEPGLVEAAKKEGKFVHYTSVPTDAAVALLDAFKKKYPFLETNEFFRSTSYKVYSRVNIETQARQYLADSVSVALTSPFREWKQKGWLMKYDSPGYKDLLKNVQDPGYWAPMRVVSIVMAYNTSILPKQEIPNLWTDLHDPKWKDALGMEGADSGSQHIQYWILKKVYGDEFWPKLLKNRPKIYSGSGALMTALLRGEIKLFIEAMGYEVYQYREIQRAPIQGIWPKGCVPMYAAPVALTANAPHPNAAKLFMDWILSKEGQEAMVRVVGADSARPDIAPAKGNPPLSAFNPVFVDDWDSFEKSTDEFKKVWESLK